MTVHDEAIWTFLDRSVPLPPENGGDWEGILSRTQAAERTAFGQRLKIGVALAVAVAIVLVATPLGAMIARGFGDFSGWLSGSAGTPVTGKEKAAFVDASKRSWVRFPKTASLRRLIDVRDGGFRYQLFGFRTGDSLCLQMAASGPSRVRSTGCVSTTELRAKRSPALPLFEDVRIVIRRVHPHHVEFVRHACVSFGIASDGVAAITAQTSAHRKLVGIVGGDGFVIINPICGQPVRSITAGDGQGDVAPVPLVRWSHFPNGWKDFNKPLPFGPQHVEHVIAHPNVAWIMHREPRGTPAPVHTHWSVQTVLFRRAIKPDPKSLILTFVSIQRESRVNGGRLDLSVSVRVGTRGTCGGGNYLDHPFPDKFPFWIMSCGSPLGDQYGIILGLAADGVERMTFFLADGEKLRVPLKYNVFALEVPFAAYPAVLAAYDKQGRVVGLHRMPGP